MANGKHIFRSDIPFGNFGLPFKTFGLFSENFRSGKPKQSYHLHPNGNFRNFSVNGKQPMSCLPGIRKSNEHCSKVVSGRWRKNTRKTRVKDTHVCTITWCLGQRVEATYRNIVGSNMLRAFRHHTMLRHVATCWVLLAQI